MFPCKQHFSHELQSTFSYRVSLKVYMLVQKCVYPCEGIILHLFYVVYRYI